MHSRLIQAQTHSGRQAVSTSMYTGSQLACPSLLSWYHRNRRWGWSATMIPAGRKHHWFLPYSSAPTFFTENNTGTTHLLDQPSPRHTLLSSRCFRPALALAKSRMIFKHSRSCSFFPPLSADQVCSLCWLLTHLLTHIRTLHLLLMLSTVSGLLDQCKNH